MKQARRTKRDAPEIVELNGVRILIDPAYMSKHVQQLVRSGRLSQPEARLMAKLVEPEDRFVELGGGIGYTSALVARQGKAASIVTFEANPQLIPVIQSNHALNGVAATAVNAVVLPEKKTETVPFAVRRHFNRSALARPERARRHVVEVPVMSFAEMIAKFAPTMLMVDIEGGEDALFQNVDLPGVRKVLVEVHKAHIGDAGIRRLFRFFSERGFRIDPAGSAGQVLLFRRSNSPLSLRLAALDWLLHKTLRKTRRRVWAGSAPVRGYVKRAAKAASERAEALALSIRRRATRGSSEIVELDGIRIRIDPAIMSEKMQQTIRSGKHSQPEARLAAQLVEPGDRFLELGGGIGFTSALVAKQGRAASVVTFEPNPHLIPAIRSNHALNRVEATVVNAVVLPDDEAKTVPFFVREHFSRSSLVKGREAFRGVVQVPAMSFAEMMKTFAPTMLMVDIQGSEASLFKDVELPGVRKVLLEVHKGLIGEDGIKRVVQFFADRGFQLDAAVSVGFVLFFRRS